MSEAKKKIMLLGGVYYLKPAIEVAHKLGLYVITADYLPNNVAHQWSDEFVNVSIVDKEAVLKVAREKEIDGILSYAVDPGVVTAAYVAEQMGLPFQCSYESASILQDKARFRRFLADNGFNTPRSKGYDSVEQALSDTKWLRWPMIVKPTDSAGSKGVNRVDCLDGYESALREAFDKSVHGTIIVENFLEKEGMSAGSESFVVDGKLVYNGVYDQHFDNEASNPYTPSAEIWPSKMPQQYQEEMKFELQRLFALLGVTTGLFNVEFRLCKDGKLYLMEVSPRAGGNRLAEMLNYAADVNIVEAEVRRAMGLPIEEIHEPNYNGHHAIVVLHANISGFFQEVCVDKSFAHGHLLEKEVRVKKNQEISSFSGANAALGTLFLRFDTRQELDEAMENKDKWLNVKIAAK